MCGTNVLDSDRVMDEGSATGPSGRWVGGSTGVTRGVGSGLLVTYISRWCCEGIRRLTLLRVPLLRRVRPRPLQRHQW